jgi:predicted dehydrogenase
MLYVGSHLVDQILGYLDDDPVEVAANTRYRADTRAEETVTFRIHFAHGSVRNSG